jgi:hypothetical protein
VLISCNTAENSNTNTISVEIVGEVQPDSLKMLNFNNSEGLVVKSGHPYHFNFKDSISDAYSLTFYKSGTAYSKKLFLDGKNLKLKAEVKSENFEIDTLIGSDVYYKSIAFYSSLDSLKDLKIDDFKVNDFLLSSLEENLNHPFAFDISERFLERNINYKSRLMDLKSLLDQQPEDLKSHALSVHRTLSDLVKTEYLNLSDFKFYDREGNIAKVDLSHQGDYLLDFWFVQCPPCVKDHKKIVKHLELFTNNNVELVGISIDTEADKWLNYLESNHYNWQNYRELGGDTDLVEAMNVWEFPTYLLVAKSGEIKTKFYAFEELEHYFSQL